MGKRSLLKTRDVDKSHFSSGSIPPELKSIISTTRCVVKILSASNLLASDADTGKSDPTCFIWFGSDDLIPNFYGPLDDSDITSQGIMQTAVLKATIDPIWNEEVIFPIDMSNPSLTSIINTKLIVHVKDWDLEDDGAINYESLGCIELSFKDIFSNGKLVNNNSISDICRQHTLKAAKGMRKVDGTLKMSVSLIFESDSNPILESRNCKTFKELYDLMTKTLKPSSDTSLSTSSDSKSAMMNTARSSVSISPLLTGRRSLSAERERERERKSLGNTSRSSSTPRIASIRPLSAGKDNFKLNDTAKLLELSLPNAIPEVSSEKEIDDDANILSELESWKLLNNVAEETKSSIQNINRDDDAENNQVNKTDISTSLSEPSIIMTTTITKNLNERSDNTSTFAGYLITVTDVMIEGTGGLSIESKNSILSYLEKNSNILNEDGDKSKNVENSDISTSLKADTTTNSNPPLKNTDDAGDHHPSDQKEEIKRLASDKINLGWSVNLNNCFSLNSTKFFPWENQITPSSNLKLIDSFDVSDHYINEKISAAAISNNKTTIATSPMSDIDFTIHMRKMAVFKDKGFISFKDKEVISFSGHTAIVRSIIFRSDDLQLATASDDKSIKLWDILSRNCTLTFSEHASGVDKIVYNSKGTELVSCSVDSVIKVWNISSGSILTSIDSHQKPITSLVSRSEHKIFSGSIDKSLKIWEYSSGNLIKSFDNLPGIVTSIAVSSNGSHVIYAISNMKDGEYDSTIKIMDDKEYKELHSVEIKGIILQLTLLNDKQDQILVCVKHNHNSKYEYILYSFVQELKLLSKVEYQIVDKINKSDNIRPTVDEKDHADSVSENSKKQTSSIQETLPPDSSSSSVHSNIDIHSKIVINSFELNDLSFYSLFLNKNTENEITTQDVLENIAFYLKSHLMSFHLNHIQPSTIQSNNFPPLVWENIQESSFDMKIDTTTAAAAALSSGDKSTPIIPIQFDLCVNNTDNTDFSKFHRLGRGLANLPLLATDISSKAKTAKIKIENLKFDFKIENLNLENIVAYICFKISQKSNLEKYLEGKLSSEEKIEPEVQQPPNLMFSAGDSALPDFEEDELNVLPSSSSSSSYFEAKEVNKIENHPDKIIKPTIPSLPINAEINKIPDKVLSSETKTSTISTRKLSKTIEIESVEIEEAIPYDDESESILLNGKKTGKQSDVRKDKKSDQKAVKTNGGGNVGTVRALKELAQQREKLEKALNDIKKSTRESIGKLTKRVQELESNSKSRSASQPNSFSADDAGDESLPPEMLTEGENNKNGTFNHEILTKTRKEKEKEKEGLMLSKANSIDLNGDPSFSSKTPDRSNNLSRTTPGRIQSNYINPNISASASPKSLEIKKELNENEFDWDDLESRISLGEVSTCFESVIKFGTLDDLGRIMEILGPHPEAISVSIRNRVYEGVSLMLHTKKSVERNLVWILALVRKGLIDTLVRHTQYDIASGLLHIAEEASKRGMLAALLEESIKKQQKSL